jgi:hypothetical protein
MKRFLAVVALGLITMKAAFALELAPHHPEQYVVKKGDTLWSVAGVFLKEPWRWPEIWHSNAGIKDPHWIYPGDVLTLAYRDGRPYLSHNRGRNRKLTPSLRESAHDHAIPPVPLDAIWPFLARPLVVAAGELANAPYIVSSQDEHLINGPDNRVYVRGMKSAEATRYTIVRCGEVYRRLLVSRDAAGRLGERPGTSQTYATTCGGEGIDPNVLGYEALYVGDAIVERFGDPASVMVTSAQREVLVGDRLIPEREEEFPEFVPHAPGAPVSSTIVSVMDALSQVGPYQVVVVDRGTDAGLEPGHVMAIHQSGVYVEDTVGARRVSYSGRISNEQQGTRIELPNERIGELMVFRVFPKISYALVMRASRSVHVSDSVKTFN